MKIRDVQRFAAGLKQVGRLSGFTLAYAVARNMRHVEPILEDLRNARKTSEAYNRYDKERVELCKVHSKKDANGKPVFSQGTYEFEDEDFAKFEAAMEELVKAHQEAIDDQERKVKEYNDLLDEDVNFDVYKVNIDILKESEITGNEVAMIFEMLDHPDGEFQAANVEAEKPVKVEAEKPAEAVA